MDKIWNEELNCFVDPVTGEPIPDDPFIWSRYENIDEYCTYPRSGQWHNLTHKKFVRVWDDLFGSWKYCLVYKETQDQIIYSHFFVKDDDGEFQLYTHRIAENNFLKESIDKNLITTYNVGKTTQGKLLLVLRDLGLLVFNY